MYERFRAGDADAFADVMRTHMGLVRKVASSFFREAFLQEEAMQEIWIHAFAKRESLDLDRLDSFAGWLATLGRRRCIDLVRQQRPADAVDDVEQLAPPTEAHTSGPELAELKEAVARFRGNLDAQWAHFFDLCFVEGLPYEDIAARLGISRLRCKYMKKVLATRARRHRPLLDALGRAKRGALPS